jgi:putative spermidine/putrescine transport system permease protein
MAQAVLRPDATLRTADGVPLRVKLRQAERVRELRAVALIAPALLFLLITFIAPIGYFLHRSIDNPEIPAYLPRTVAALASWHGEELPHEAAFQALVVDLRDADPGALAALARRLNYHEPGYRTLVLLTARKLASAKEEPASWREALIDANALWGERATWATIAQESGPLTPYYLLASLDLQRDADGFVVAVEADRAIYRTVFARTFWISLVVTGLCVVLGFPLAYLLATVPARIGNWLLLLVLLPFWTSLLVRTLAWLVIFQGQGVANQGLMLLGLVSEPMQLIRTRFAVYVAMVHILLPFMVLPLYSVMRRISPSHMRAATSLGAHPAVAFWTVYVPQTIPGIGAGVLLVSVLALGFYITPMLLGGGGDQMISYFVAFYTNESVNWGMAAALGTWLLVFALALFLVLNRVVGFDRMRLG